ncbi:unnamed protein product [Pedinophyceae sp. YPF-701]|nr:unnamed protein product [Pedinophyceae sp. YPF-701]
MPQGDAKSRKNRANGAAGPSARLPASAPAQEPPAQDAHAAAQEAVSAHIASLGKVLSSLSRCEQDLWDMETKYLRKVSQKGNVIRGYQGLVDQRVETPPLDDEDRIFSKSAVLSTSTLARR